jgi:hypothetical protein
MAGYHFVSIRQISAPIEQVWEGTGRWTLTAADDGTLVRSNWDIRTTRRWMNLAALGALGWRRRVSPR